MTDTPKPHGGVREGAGRPPSGNIKVRVSLSPADIQAAEAEGPTVPSGIRAIIAKHRASKAGMGKGETKPPGLW